MKSCRYLCAFFLCVIPIALVWAQTIIVDVTGFRSRDGDMLVALYKNSDQFPNDPAIVVIQNKETVDSDTISLKFKNLLPGKYALSVLDDENANGVMDKRLLIPREGFCFSRFVPKGLTYPIWDNCCFDLDYKDVTLTLQLYYF